MQPSPSYSCLQKTSLKQVSASFLLFKHWITLLWHVCGQCFISAGWIHLVRGTFLFLFFTTFYLFKKSFHQSALVWVWLSGQNCKEICVRWDVLESSSLWEDRTQLQSQYIDHDGDFFLCLLCFFYLSLYDDWLCETISDLDANTYCQWKTAVRSQYQLWTHF